MAACWHSAARRVAAGGFTIIELVIVMAVVSTVLALGVPQFAQLMANTRVRSAAESVQSGLRVAQIEAMKRSIATEWTLTSADPVPGNVSAAVSSSARNWMARVRADATRGENNPTFLRGSEAANAQGATVTNQTGTFSVVFLPTGQVMRGDAGGPTALGTPMVMRVTAAGANRPMCVMASPTGSIKICDPQLASGDPRACQPAITSGACPGP
jgi:type IV fimbrial biogenesis protein FimT